MTDILLSLAVGSLILACALIYAGFAYAVFVGVQWLRGVTEVETHYNLLEMSAVKKKAKEKGIDLEKELIKGMYRKNMNSCKSFRQRMKAEIYKDFFGEEMPAKGTCKPKKDKFNKKKGVK